MVWKSSSVTAAPREDWARSLPAGTASRVRSSSMVAGSRWQKCAAPKMGTDSHFRLSSTCMPSRPRGREKGVSPPFSSGPSVSPRVPEGTKRFTRNCAMLRIRRQGTNVPVVGQFAGIRRFVLVAWASGPQRRRPRRRSFALCGTATRGRRCGRGRPRHQLKLRHYCLAASLQRSIRTCLYHSNGKQRLREAAGPGRGNFPAGNS